MSPLMLLAPCFKKKYAIDKISRKLIFSLGVSLLLTACQNVPPQFPNLPETPRTPHTPSDPLSDILNPDLQRPPQDSSYGTNYSNPNFQELIPNWHKDDVNQAWQAWLKTCERIGAQPMWQDVCHIAQNTTADMARRYFEENFEPVLVQANQGINKATGYYEPLFKGRLKPDAYFKYPLYAMPAHLKNTALTRAELMQSGALNGYELIYLDNPIDAAIVQVQGSGLFTLDDGGIMRMGFAGSNQHPFKSFIQDMIQKGYIDKTQASNDGVRAWSLVHPELVNDALNTNPRFIFFKPMPYAQNGPIGALGLHLHPQRSVAVDPRYTSLGTPLFVSFQHPNLGEVHRLVMAHDVGSAIQSSNRIDFFWGVGDLAGKLASSTNSIVKMVVLMPKIKPRERIFLPASLPLP